MSRPTKCRRVCGFPKIAEFYPENGREQAPIILTVDEFEVIRLIDREGLTQEQCSRQLGVGRTTVQKICETARKKLADTLVLGLPLKIEGGDYRLCSGMEDVCFGDRCCKKKRVESSAIEKGGNIVRIAVTYENGEIFQHFGHTEQFKVYDAQDQKIIASRILETNGTGHGALASMLQAQNVDVLICGGIGNGAKQALAEAGIRLCGGVSGSADAAIEAFLAGTLQFNPDIRCNHHEEEGGRTSHMCGQNGCGGGHCGGKERD